MVAFTGVRVGMAAEVVGAEVMESCVRILEQVPNDDQNGTSDGDDCAFLAAAPRDSSVAFAEEGIGSSDGDGGFAEDAGEVAVAVSGRAVALGLPGGGVDARGEFSPGA